jgi:hypothetical protein
MKLQVRLTKVKGESCASRATDTASSFVTGAVPAASMLVGLRARISMRGFRLRQTVNGY